MRQKIVLADLYNGMFWSRLDVDAFQKFLLKASERRDLGSIRKGADASENHPCRISAVSPDRF